MAKTSLGLRPDERAKVGSLPGLPVPLGHTWRQRGNFVRTALVSLTKPRARTESRIARSRSGKVRTQRSAAAGADLAAPTYVGRGGVAAAQPRPQGVPQEPARKAGPTRRWTSSFATRYVNDGFSGGEKKRLEVLQMAMLKPKVAMLDEPDSGLDIDAVRVVADGVNSLRGPEMGILLVTHYQRILNYVKPDFVHVMIEGQASCSQAGLSLAQELEATGLRLAARRLRRGSRGRWEQEWGTSTMTTPSSIETQANRKSAGGLTREAMLDLRSAVPNLIGCDNRASKAGRPLKTCPCPSGPRASPNGGPPTSAS